jgi:hypothetical protein
MGKMVGGKLFSVQDTQTYSKRRLSDYELCWPTEAIGRRAMIEGEKSILAIGLIADEARWLEDHYGINIDSLGNRVWTEFQKPENQEWLQQVREAHQVGSTNI